MGQVRKPRTYDIQDTDLKKFHEDLYKIFQKGISFGRTAGALDQNIEGFMADVTGSINTGPANTDFAVVHNLGYAPKFFTLHNKNVACDVYIGVTPWTATTSYFRCTVANAQVRIFIH
jgi:hypothetical protein